MEDGIERMMSSELYNIHFLNEYKNKKNIKNNLKKNHVKELTTNQPELYLKDIKEPISRSTNPQ